MLARSFLRTLVSAAMALAVLSAVVGLNPQPLPPRDNSVELNPQPLPPGGDFIWF